MKVYLNVIFNHFRALQAWAANKDVSLTLNLTSFELEVKHRGRYYQMHPLFQARVEGRQVHSTTIPTELVGFGGWRPYRPVQHLLSTEKLRFKQHLVTLEMATPRSVAECDIDLPVPFDFLLKANVGSFGRQIAGPFRAGRTARSVTTEASNVGPSSVGKSMFVEAFIEGTILKVWFWGEKPFFAHAHEFPTLAGDGVSPIDSLLRARLRSCALDWDTYAERDVVLNSLRFQGFEVSTVLPAGVLAWFDFRYSQRYEPVEGPTADSDNALAWLTDGTRTQLADMGRTLADLLRDSFAAPVLISVDGMLGQDATIQWLEMNVNSIMPPEGYAAMFDDLFA